MKKSPLLYCFILATLVANGHPVDSLQITVHGVNLSEDMSTLSSKNDELLLLIYDFNDTSRLSAPLLSEYFVTDSAHRKTTFPFAISDDQTNLLIFLAELDTERSPDVVEKLIRKYFKEIMTCINQRDLIALQKFIGDDDILGIKVLNNSSDSKGTTFSFQGRYKLDKYLYRVEVKK